MFLSNRDLKVDSVGELTIWDGNEFQTLTTRFEKEYLVASTEQVSLISLRSCPLVRLSVDLIRTLASCELKPLLSR